MAIFQQNDLGRTVPGDHAGTAARSIASWKHLPGSARRG